MSNFSIRKLVIGDYEAVYSLWLNTPGMCMNDRDDSREGIEAYLRRNPNTCFAAVCGEKIIGVILSGHDGRRGYIYHTCVAQEARYEGIGRSLANSALDALKAEGISKTALVVFGKNEIGNAFWEKIGFTVRPDLVYRNMALAELVNINA